MAMRYMIIKGDKTTHGGTVLEGHESYMIEDAPVACMGHQVYCPQCGGNYPIVEGTTRNNIFGQPAALEGMKTACGAELISSQRLSSVEIESAADIVSNVTLMSSFDVNHSQALTAEDVPPTHFASINTLTSDEVSALNLNVLDENLTEGVEAWLITTYGLYQYSVLAIRASDHSALYIAIDEEKILFDPAGSYLSGRRGSGDFFVDEEADLNDFCHYHQNNGDRVSLSSITLTRKQAKNVFNKIINYGSPVNLYCASAVSNVLSEDFGTKATDLIVLPDHLRENVEKIEVRKRKKK